MSVAESHTCRAPSSSQGRCPCGVPLPEAGIRALTSREHEVFELLGSGLSNQEIAGCLVISGSTVKAHLGRILVKLGVDSRTRAALLAQRLLLQMCPNGQ
ncbi:helix-turn-helix transcriptional regulator [Kitasatospora sp. NBC_01287]|uniref:response regulator transcription factor n=1 Tax=Kitasatospora sp. NBC_01287 TaxID=2903573 RepID=UPI00224F9882|nr:helix-turn-helix transcriptional regulator [Kitasatospora sp. NBC_01287]MCX4745060.1 helix-turn-helix transcriptional regulator [Kitasatospora sp. NBC_01287]